MNIQQKGIITLIKSALTGEKYELPEAFDLVQVKKIIRQHNIAAIIYYGALGCGVSTDSDVIGALFTATCKYLSASELQLREIEKILCCFEENEIDHMPLKGTLLKLMYPKSEMRVMGDADILVRTEQLEKITALMEKLGYTYVGSSNHEEKWTSKHLFLELHTRLIPSYNKDYYAYFGDGWRLAKSEDSGHFRYKMSAEDNLIYLFTHFAKHYRDAGIGIKQMVDLWVYKVHNPDLNEEYVLKELEKLQLNEFYLNIMDTLAVWFSDNDGTAVTDFITDIIFNSGVFGTREAQILSSALKTSKTVGSAKKVRIKKYFQLIFLPYKSMTVKYPFLKKAPYLLPIMWVYRAFYALFNKRDKIKFENDKVTAMTQDNIDEYQMSLNYVGLDFNFKE